MKIPEYNNEYLMFGMMFVIGNRLQVIGDKFYEEITAKQWFVIAMLEVFEENYPTLNDLSDALGSSHQNVKQLIIKLENKGYVTTFLDEEDRRKMRIRMTQKCVVFKDKYGHKQQEFMKQLFKGIDEKALKTTVATLVQFENNMKSMKGDK